MLCYARWGGGWRVMLLLPLLANFKFSSSLSLSAKGKGRVSPLFLLRNIPLWTSSPRLGGRSPNRRRRHCSSCLSTLSCRRCCCRHFSLSKLYCILTSLVLNSQSKSNKRSVARCTSILYHSKSRLSWISHKVSGLFFYLLWSLPQILYEIQPDDVHLRVHTIYIFFKYS